MVQDERDREEMTSQDIKRRYFREVSACPDGMVTHHGDCHYYRVRICTCGLLHDLMAMPTQAEGLFSHYPTQWPQHENALDSLFELMRGASREEEESKS